MRRRVYVWQIPVRLTHWVNVLSMVLLCFTGYYIANPYLKISPQESYSSFFMGWTRYIHFAVAFVFIASVLYRTYWAFMGNAWASWRGLFPFLTRRGRQSMLHAFQYYFFMRREPPESVGHNALAGFSYMVIVTLYFVIIVTGVALFGQLHPESITFGMTNWIFAIFTMQTVRLVHHAVMWLLLCFVVWHIYVAWLIDMEEGNGLMSSIFSGFKFIRPGQAPDWIEPRKKRAATAEAVEAKAKI